MTSDLQVRSDAASAKIPLVRDVNLEIACSLCAGYIVNATTITECLHTFCRSCLQQHFEQEGRMVCPQCGVELNEKQAEALSQVRFDRKYQTLIYQLVPGLRQQELKQREEYIAANKQKSISSIHDADLVSGTAWPTSRDDSSASKAHAVRIRESFSIAAAAAASTSAAALPISCSNRDGPYSTMNSWLGDSNAAPQRCARCLPKVKLRDVFIDLRIEPLTSANTKQFYVRCRAHTTIAQLLAGVTQELFEDEASTEIPKSVLLYCEDEPLDDVSLTLFDCWCERWFGNKGNMLFKYRVVGCV